MENAYLKLVEVVRSLINQEKPPGELLQLYIDAALDFVQLDSALVLEFHEDGFRVVYASDDSDKYKTGDLIEFGETPCGKVIQRGEPLFISDTSKSSIFDDLTQEMSCGSFVGTLIYQDRRVSGVLAFKGHKKRENKFTHVEKNFLNIINSLVSRWFYAVKVKNELEGEKNKFESLFKYSPLMMHAINQDKKIIFVNDAWLKKMEYSRDEVIGKYSYEFLSPSNQKLAKEMISNEIFSKKIKSKGKSVKTQFLTKSGKVIDVNLYSSSEKNKEGVPTKILAILIDVTQEERAHHEMEELKRKYNFILTSIKSGFLSYSFDTNEMFFDEKTFEILGVRDSSFEPAVESFVNLFDPEAKKNLIEIFDYNKKEILEWSREMRLLSHVRPRFVRAHLKYDNKLNKIFGILTDVTEENEMQQAAIVSSKFASLGEMAGGIAHEINNPLAIISANCDLQKRRIELGKNSEESTLKSIDLIISTVKRMSKIVNGLRLFSRNEAATEMDVTTVEQVVEDTLSLCSERFKNHGIELKVDENDSLPELYCNSIQVSQVLLNLLNNAFDAVGVLEEKWVTLTYLVEPDYVLIKVTDSGNGIPKELHNKIMEPFFTTKPAGVGTGMGLSISKGMMKTNGGDLFYDLNSSHTCFILKIPTADSADIAA
tara:strand:- start:215 stop:2179 length:1965 start_codon:yes stop_codon:yes gene_type:complete